jgi:hypothetical protein
MAASHPWANRAGAPPRTVRQGRHASARCPQFLTSDTLAAAAALGQEEHEKQECDRLSAGRFLRQVLREPLPRDIKVAGQHEVALRGRESSLG